MSGKKIIFLIQPLKEPSSNKKLLYNDLHFQEPYPLECLEAILEKNDYDCKIFCGHIDEQELIANIKKLKPLAVCFNVHTYTYNKSVSLARVSKIAATECTIQTLTIFGGYHPTAMPKETAKEDYVDFVVIGEGENTLLGLLDANIYNKPYLNVPGLAFKHNNEIILTSPRKRIQNLDELPFPKRHKEFLDKTVHPQIIYPAANEQKSMARVNYSRGCFFDCYFCGSKDTWDQKVFWRSPTLVVDEIQALNEQYGTNLIGFADLTLNSDKKKTIELCNELIKRDLPVNWWALVRADKLDEETLHLMHKAKCVKLHIGIESFNETIANKIKEDYKVNNDYLLNILNIADDLGFIIKTLLIVGFENETIEMIRTYKNFLIQFPIDELSITFATPLPGSRFWEELRKEGILPANPKWNTFTCEDPMPLNSNITSEELMKARNELMYNYYLHEHYIEHLRKKIKKFPYLKNSWVQYFNFLQKNNVVSNFDKIFLNLINQISDIN